MSNAMQDDNTQQDVVETKALETTRFPLTNRLYAIRELCNSIALLQRAGISNDYNLVSRSISTYHFVSSQVTLKMIHDAITTYYPILLPLYEKVAASTSPCDLDRIEEEEISKFSSLRQQELSHRENVAKIQAEKDKEEATKREEALKLLLVNASASNTISKLNAKRRGVIITESAQRDELVRRQKEADLDKKNSKDTGKDKSSTTTTASKKAEEEDKARKHKKEAKKIQDHTFDVMLDEDFLRMKPIKPLKLHTSESTKTDNNAEDSTVTSSPTSPVSTTSTQEEEMKHTGLITTQTVIPTVECLLRLLLARVAYLRSNLDLSISLLRETIDWLLSRDLRILDPFFVPIFMLLALVVEKKYHSLTSIQSLLLQTLPIVTRAKDINATTAVSVCLLRSYILEKQFSECDDFVTSFLSGNTEKTTTSQDSRDLLADRSLIDPVLRARLSYYIGLNHAMALRYASAYEYVSDCLRSCPDHERTGRGAGIYQAATKLLIICSLLKGVIPDRSNFTAKCLNCSSVKSYYKLVSIVKNGEINLYKNMMQDKQFINQAVRDGLYSLVLRLENAVIKAAITSLSKSYSKLPFEVVAKKLGLSNEIEAELICCHAIANGIVNSTIDSNNNTLLNEQSKDEYGVIARGALLDRILLLSDLVVSTKLDLKHFEDDFTA